MLSIVRGQGKGTTFQLNQSGRISFGRSNDCQVRFNVRGVSRRHFAIEGSEEGYVIIDLHSSNGTFVNGIKITRQRLNHHDIIVVGDLVLRFACQESSEPPHDVTVNFSEERSPQHFFRQKIDLDQCHLMSAQVHAEQDALEIKKHLKTLYEVGNLINSEPDPERLLEAIMDSLFETLPFDRGALVIVLNDRDDYEIKAYRFRSAQNDKQFTISKTILTETTSQGVSILSRDARHDVRFKDAPSILGQQDLKSIMCAPLQSRNKILGAIYLDSCQQEPFSQSDLEFLTAVGLQAGIALEKALLFEEITRIQSYQQFVMEHLPLGIHSFDQHGVFTSWSRYSEKLFGLSAAEVIGKRDLSFFFPEPGQVQKVLRIVSQKGLFQKEIMLRRNPESDPFPCHVVLTQLYDHEDNLIGYTGYHLDMSREREFQEQLIRQEKMAAMGLLAAGISHDLLNIMSSIKGYATLACQKPDKAPKYLQIVETNIERANQLARSLLNYARKEAEAFEPTDLIELLEETLVLVQKNLYYGEVEVSTAFVPLPPVKVIPAQIQEVFLNIILNAKDAMPQGGQLHISATLEKPWVHFAFQDNGIGIPVKLQEKIFEPLFSTKKKEGRGTGLGLSMVYSIIKKHGGKIEVVSAEGAGATFHVFLPIERSQHIDTTTLHLRPPESS